MFPFRKKNVVMLYGNTNLLGLVGTNVGTNVGTWPNKTVLRFPKEETSQKSQAKFQNIQT